jgi:hypothetical protein
MPSSFIRGGCGVPLTAFAGTSFACSFEMEPSMLERHRKPLKTATRLVMPRYFFNLNDGRKIIPDLEGTELPDHDCARAHACQVVRELARNRERRTRSWRLAVCDVHCTLCFELLFASMDDSISRLDACRDTASLNDAIEQSGYAVSG